MRTTGNSDLINGLHLLGEASKGNVQPSPPLTPKQALDSKIHKAIEEFEMDTGTITKSLVVNFDRVIEVESV